MIEWVNVSLFIQIYEFNIGFNIDISLLIRKNYLQKKFVKFNNSVLSLGGSWIATVQLNLFQYPRI